MNGWTGWYALAKKLQAQAQADVILPSFSMASQDAEAIQAVLEGDVNRFAELVDRYQAQAQRVAFSFLGNYDDAKDISQEAFVNAFRSLRRFRGKARFSTWLYRIVINECKDAQKQRARQPAIAARIGPVEAELPEAETGLFVDVPDAAANPGEQAQSRELSRQLSHAIRGLPMTQQTVFLLHHVHGCSLEEVAEVLDCRVGTVKSHLFRATDRLKTLLRPMLEREGLR